MFYMPIINAELCNGCGLCLAVCECGALVITQSIVSIQQTDNCGYCTECEAVCPTGAIQCPFEIVVEDSLEQTLEQGFE
jgi:MinD superfamily P-loop ATPase